MMLHHGITRNIGKKCLIFIVLVAKNLYLCTNQGEIMAQQGQHMMMLFYVPNFTLISTVCRALCTLLPVLLVQINMTKYITVNVINTEMKPEQ